MQTVHSAMMNCLFPNKERTGIVVMVGKMERMTCGIVSPARIVLFRANFFKIKDQVSTRTYNDSKCAHPSECKGELKE